MALHLSARAARVVAWVAISVAVVLAALLAGTWIFVSRLTLTAAPPEPPPLTRPAEPAPVSPLLVRYKLELPGRGEVFPALSVGKVADYWPVAVLNISNTADQPVMQTVSAEVPGWSRRAQYTLVLGPQESQMVRLDPELLPRAYRNQSIREATLEVTVSTPEHGATFAQTRPVLLHGGSALYWGKRFSNAQFVSRWVTPHDPAVLQLVSSARRFVPGGRMAGYSAAGSNSPRAVAAYARRQAEAVFRALQRSGISYVSSIFTFGTFGEAQRIRLPGETLSLKTANCMDVSVAFAAAMENLGMRPVLIIVPGHAFTGVRLGPDSDDILYLDLTVLPKGSFRSAEQRARNWLKKTPQEEVITIDVAAARALGIYPLPSGD